MQIRQIIGINRNIYAFVSGEKNERKTLSIFSLPTATVKKPTFNFCQCRPVPM